MPGQDHLQLSPPAARPALALLPLPQLLRPLGQRHLAEPGVSAKTQQAVAQIPGTSWVGPLSANSNRDVAILIPEGVNPTRPIELIYYFHGHNGTIAASLTDSRHGMQDTINRMAHEQGRNFVLVVPQGPPQALDYTWMNPQSHESYAGFDQQVRQKLAEKLFPGIQIASVTVKGHSAGGLPLLNAARSGQLNATRVDFLDASYGNWASETWRLYHSSHPQSRFNAVYIPGTGTEADSLRLRGKPGVNLLTSQYDHGRIPKFFLSLP